MKLHMLKWAVEHQPPGPTFVVACDKDYVRTIKPLLARNFKVTVSYITGKTSPEMINVAPRSVKWTSMGTGKILKKHVDNRWKFAIGFPHPRQKFGELPENRLVKVFWDPKSALFPSDGRGRSLLNRLHPNVEGALTILGYRGIENIEAVVGPEELVAVKRGWNIITTLVKPPTKKKKDGENHVDVHINELMNNWSLLHENKFSLMLISNDRRAAGVVRSLIAYGVDVIWSHKRVTHYSITTAPSMGLDWDPLVRNGEAQKIPTHRRRKKL